MLSQLTAKPIINVNICNGCGYCVTVCHLNGLLIINKVAIFLDEVECDWCTHCEMVCPLYAISCPFEIVLDESQ